MQIITVKDKTHLAEIRKLFREYEKYLAVDLCFQNFEDELKNLPGKYSPPGGIILLAADKEKTIGCVALKKLTENICEMKRLYVKSQYRGQGIGRLLAEEIIKKATNLGYERMYLDTLDHLIEAMHLYESLGFKRRDPYYTNPLQGVVFWEKDLRDD